MSRQPILWILTAIVALIPVRAWGDPIAISRPFDAGVGAFVSNTGEGWLAFRAFPGQVELFGIPITAADIGRTFLTDATTDSDFGAFAAVMTNGRAETVEVLFGPSSGGIPLGFLLHSGTGERGFFDLPAGVVDFRGFTLTGIAFHVESFSALSRPDIGDPFTLFNLRGTFSVFGSGAFNTSPVPEPATLTLFATGALGAAWLRRRRPLWSRSSTRP